MDNEYQKAGILNEDILVDSNPEHIEFKSENHENFFVKNNVDYYDSVNILRFHNCRFKRFSLQKGAVRILKFTNCEIQELITYDTNAAIELESCIINEVSTGLGVERFNISKCIISNCEIEKLFLLHTKEVLINENITKEIICRNIEFLRIKNQNFNDLIISLSAIKELHLSSQNIKSLEIFESIPLKGNLELKNIESISITECDLKDVVIVNSDFSTIKQFDILTSDYDGIKINDLIYPDQLINRNTHRLLKRIAIQNNDLINGKLQGIQELICYRKELWKEQNYFSWFPLWAGYLTNKNGSSIKRSLISWVMASLIFFIAASSFYSIPLLEQMLSGRFFIFSLNPTHSLESVFPQITKEKFEPIILSLDYIGRVVIGFMLFQIISAFRFFFKNN